MMVLLKASLSCLPRFSKKSNSLFIVVFFSFSEVLWQGCVLVDTVKIPTSKRGLDRFDRWLRLPLLQNSRDSLGRSRVWALVEILAASFVFPSLTPLIIGSESAEGSFLCLSHCQINKQNI